MILSTLVLLVSLESVLSLEGCWEPLGLEDGRIGDSQIRASSSYSPESVGPSAGRLNSEKGGGAWCPKNLITENMDTQEFLEIDLEYNHVITAVVTQGRFANGRGAEFAEFYIVQYWREGMEAFQDYVTSEGEKILEGNKNTFSESKIVLDTPIAASKMRIIPYSHHPRTVCMRVEFLGCLEDAEKVKTVSEIKDRKEETKEDRKEEIRNVDNYVEDKEVDVYLRNKSESIKATESGLNNLIMVNNGWGPHYLGAVVGLLLTVILILVILIIIILRRTIKRKQFSSNTNISFTSSLARKSEIYKEDLENGPIYQEPFLLLQDTSPYNQSILDSSLDSYPAPCLPTSNSSYSTVNNTKHLEQIYSVPLFTHHTLQTNNFVGNQQPHTSVDTFQKHLNFQTMCAADNFNNKY